MDTLVPLYMQTRFGKVSETMTFVEGRSEVNKKIISGTAFI